jgi:hypothetical protein
MASKDSFWEGCMKVVIVFDDCPTGIYPELYWKGNDCCDHLPDSVSMHLAALFVKQIEDMEKAGTLVVVRSVQKDKL